MLTLYLAPYTRSRGTLWLLEELDVAFETHVVDVRNGAPEDYREIHPHKKVPAIVHDGLVITERAAIAIYLADRFPGANLAPPVGDPRRGLYLTWLVYNDAVLDPADVAQSFKWQYDPRVVSFGRYEDAVANIQRTLARQPYLTGDTATAADIAIADAINFGINISKHFPRSPEVDDFLKRMFARPAFARTRARIRALSEQRGRQHHESS